MKTEAKKVSAPKAADVSATRIFHFIGEVKDEFQKVNWTDQEELIAYTKIVVWSTLTMGMVIYFSDLLIQGVLNTVGMILRLFG